MYKILKPGGQLIFTTFDRLPMDKAYEELDKSKWKKYQHFRAMSPFWNSTNPFEDYKNLTKVVGFQEDIMAIVNDCYLYAPSLTIFRGKRTFYSMFNIYI